MDSLINCGKCAALIDIEREEYLYNPVRSSYTCKYCVEKKSDYDDGYDDGYEDGRDDANDYEYDRGYDQGYDDGTKAARESAS